MERVILFLCLLVVGIQAVTPVSFSCTYQSADFAAVLTITVDETTSYYGFYPITSIVGTVNSAAIQLGANPAYPDGVSYWNFNSQTGSSTDNAYSYDNLFSPTSPNLDESGLIVYTSTHSYNLWQDGSDVDIIYGNTIASDTPSTEPGVFSCGPSAVVTADPHFSGFSGEKFDFMGEPGKVFSLFSSFDLEVNARFVAAQHPEYYGDDAVFMGEIGIKQGVESEASNYILFTQKDDPKIHPFKEAPLVVGDGRDNNTKTQSFVLNNGGSAFWRAPGQIEVRFAEYVITVTREFERNSLHNNVEEVYMSVSMVLLYDFRGKAHGLIGQTTVPSEQRPVGPYNQFQGEGKIEGEMKDYIIKNDDIFGVLFPFSLYNKTSSAMNSTNDSLLKTALVADVIKK